MKKLKLKRWKSEKVNRWKIKKVKNLKSGHWDLKNLGSKIFKIWNSGKGMKLKSVKRRSEQVKNLKISKWKSEILKKWKT